ncbi:MAG: hypothetical protein ACXWG6_01330, partial [Usitatibacter sp.]
LDVMNRPKRSMRELVSEGILLGGFIFVLVWPAVILDFGIWAFLNFIVVCLIAWAFRAAPDDSRIKTTLFGTSRPRDELSNGSSDSPKE